jgi:phosphotransferase family enzyme
VSVTAEGTAQDLFSGRDGLEAVRWALHGEGPRRAIRRAVAAQLESGAALGPCRVVRTKYKPGRKLTVHMEACVASPTGTHRRQLVAIWGAADATIGSGPTRSELETVAVSSGLASPFARLTAEVPSIGVSILISPMDPSLPQLLHLVDPGYVEALLDPLVERRLGAAGRWRVEAERYRPGERHVLRYSDGTPRGSVFAKLGRGHDVGREFLVATLIADRLAEAGQRSQGVRPLAALEHERAILFPEVSGVQLSRLFKRGDHSSDMWLRVAGRLLRTLHDPPQLAAGELGHRAFGDEVARARRATEHVRALLPPAGRIIDRILEEATMSMDGLPPEPPTFTHGDAKADHLWISRKGLTLMDFGTCATADPALDIGKLLADAAWWGQCSDGHLRADAGVRRAEAALLAGYGPDEGQRRQRAHAWASVLFVTVVGHRAPLSDPRWAERTTALLHSAHAFLDGSLQK